MSTRLHLCGITSDGKLWHASRSRDEFSSVAAWAPWSPWEEVKAQNVGSFVSVACGVRYFEDEEEVHLCAVTQDGRLWYTSRGSAGDWQPFEDLRTHIQSDWESFQVQDVTLGRFLLDVCVIVLTKSGERRILRTSRHLDGTWESFQDVNDPQLAGFPGSFLSVACANVSPEPPLDELHLCGVTADGRLWHTLRSFLAEAFSWLPFADVQTVSTNAPDHFTNASIAQGSPDLQGRQDLHVFAQAAGDLWHTVRSSNPPGWQSTFERVKEQAGDPGSFSAISCAIIDEQLHICAISADGKLWHTLRSASGTTAWQSFEDVTAAGSAAPGTFRFISVAVIFVPPARTADDATCQSIRWGIANDRLQMSMMERRDPNNPYIESRREHIAYLQSLGQQHPCPPEDFW